MYAHFKRAIDMFVEGPKTFDITDMKGNSYRCDTDRDLGSLCASGIKDCLGGSEKPFVIDRLNGKPVFDHKGHFRGYSNDR